MSAALIKSTIRREMEENLRLMEHVKELQRVRDERATLDKLISELCKVEVSVYSPDVSDTSESGDASPEECPACGAIVKNKLKRHMESQKCKDRAAAVRNK